MQKVARGTEEISQPARCNFVVSCGVSGEKLGNS